MNPRTLIFAVVALAAAGGTAFMIQAWMDNQRAALLASVPKEAKPVGNEVLVARKDLPAGTILRPDDLRWQIWPEGSVPGAYAVKGRNQLKNFVGNVIRRGVGAGEPLTLSRVVKPGERGFMAAVLSDDYRAVTVPINATSGVAGFIFPGDRVDLILAHEFRSDGEDSGKKSRVAGETVLTNLRVLAIDQRTDDQKGRPALGKTVTLEVTPKQVEKIAVAAQLGRLSLALRGLRRDRADRARTNDVPVAATGSDPAFATSVAGPAGPALASTAADGRLQLYPAATKAAARDKAGGDGDGKPAASYTWDSDTSALIGKTDTVIVIHGKDTEILKLGRGN
jgi:pilus assembly protein CpaB